MTDAEVEKFLKEAGLWQGPVTVKPLKGGYWNEVLRVTTGTRKLTLKRFSKETSGTLFPNRPKDEARALERLEGLDVAPRLVGFWPELSLMVYEYVEGSIWANGTADVARLLLRKEVADPTGFRAVPLMPADIMAEGDVMFARCTAAPPGRRPNPGNLPLPQRLSLIHTDIGPGNLIGSGESLRIIDWQCPAIGDLTEDIFSFLSPAFQILSAHDPLTAGEEAEFWSALNRPDLYARYRILRPAFAWRMAAYCLWQSETRPEPEIRASYTLALAAEMAAMDPQYAD